MIKKKQFSDHETSSSSKILHRDPKCEAEKGVEWGPLLKSPLAKVLVPPRESVPDAPRVPGRSLGNPRPTASLTSGDSDSKPTEAMGTKLARVTWVSLGVLPSSQEGGAVRGWVCIPKQHESQPLVGFLPNIPPAWSVPASRPSGWPMLTEATWALQLLSVERKPPASPSERVKGRKQGDCWWRRRRRGARGAAWTGDSCVPPQPCLPVVQGDLLLPSRFLPSAVALNKGPVSAPSCSLLGGTRPTRGVQLHPCFPHCPAPADHT